MSKEIAAQKRKIEASKRVISRAATREVLAKPQQAPPLEKKKAEDQGTAKVTTPVAPNKRPSRASSGSGRTVVAPKSNDSRSSATPKIETKGKK